VDFPAFIEENKHLLLPPVCNKLIFGDQLKVMIVGGPNTRTDYHLEVGEELFYQVKGDMVVKILEQGRHKDVVIKEGEIFILPGHIPHSPQRQANTVGLVIERDRVEEEKDGLIWWVGDTHEVLYEAYFHCTDLGVQLKPIIERFRASDAFKTGVSNKDDGTVLAEEERPISIDPTLTTLAPVHLDSWLAQHDEELRSKGSKVFWEGKEFTLVIYKDGVNTETQTLDNEVWFYQYKGSAELVLPTKAVNLFNQAMMVLPPHTSYSLKQHEHSVCLVMQYHTQGK